VGGGENVVPATIYGIQKNFMIKKYFCVSYLWHDITTEFRVQSSQKKEEKLPLSLFFSSMALSISSP
jgi:hypothetical protein